MRFVCTSEAVLLGSRTSTGYSTNPVTHERGGRKPSSREWEQSTESLFPSSGLFTLENGFESRRLPASVRTRAPQRCAQPWAVSGPRPGPHAALCSRPPRRRPGALQVRDRVLSGRLSRHHQRPVRKRPSSVALSPAPDPHSGPIARCSPPNRLKASICFRVSQSAQRGPPGTLRTVSRSARATKVAIYHGANERPSESVQQTTAADGSRARSATGGARLPGSPAPRLG